MPITERALYRESALRIINSLTAHYAEWDDPAYEGILKEATGHLPAGQNINVSLIYGDYYYVETAAKLWDGKTGSSDPVFGRVYLFFSESEYKKQLPPVNSSPAFGPHLTAMSGNQLLDDGQPHSTSAA